MNERQCQCPVCGRELSTARLSVRDRWFGVGDAFELRECPDCQLAVTYPQPAGTELERYYPAQYDAWQRPNSMLRAARGLTARVRATLPPYGLLRRRGTGRLLDVGCGRGDLASNFARAGWTSAGLDISPAAVQAAREVGVDAHVGTIETAPWADASFDLIIMSHSLEHMPEPVQALQSARRLLREGGTLVIAVPNWDSWQRRLFGASWTPLDVPRHLTHFSPRALHRAARETGYRGGRVRNYPTGIGLPLSLWFALGGSTLVGRRQTVLLMAGAALYPITWLAGRVAGGDATYFVAER
jgi:SAM-dependent methyltransferase